MDTLLRWLDIGRVLFCVFVGLNKIGVHNTEIERGKYLAILTAQVGEERVSEIANVFRRIRIGKKSQLLQHNIEDRLCFLCFDCLPPLFATTLPKNHELSNSLLARDRSESIIGPSCPLG